MMTLLDPPLHERVYNGIKADYLDGRFTPGRRIDLQNLADRYRSSKTPVREAAFILIGEGLLSHHLDGGFLVPIRPPSEVVALLAWRMQLVLAGASLASELVLIDYLEKYVLPSEAFSANEMALQLAELFTGLAGVSGNMMAQDQVRKINERLHYSRDVGAMGVAYQRKLLKNIVKIKALSIRKSLVRKLTKFHDKEVWIINNLWDAENN